MNIIHRYKETCADGPGIRYSIYVAGCETACKNCHNPDTWDFDSGTELTEDLFNLMCEELSSNPLLTGITLTGGDPLHPKNLDGSFALLDYFYHLSDYHIMVYTGRTIEQLLIDSVQNTKYIDIMQYIDILVEGPYIEELKEDSTFKGSSNQRFIDAKKIYYECKCMNDFLNVKEKYIIKKL